MTAVVADTSGLLAAFDAGEAEHARAAELMDWETLLISPCVLTELDFLIRRKLSFPSAMQAIDALIDRIDSGRYRLVDVRQEDLATAQAVRADYSGLQLDLADAVGVAIAGRYRTDRIFTFD